MNEFIIIMVLLACLVGLQIYYTWQIHQFVDKMMSRSFMEYQRAKELPKEAKSSHSPMVFNQEGEDISRV